MPWTPITLADLNDARVGDLITALRTEALAVSQTDPMPRRIQTVVDEIRRCIGACSSTPLDIDTAKIPLGLRDMATEKIVRGLKGRLQLPLSDEEKEAEKLYQKRLEQLTRGEWPVDKPDVVEATPVVQTSGGAEIVSNPGRRLTRDNLSAL